MTTSDTAQPEELAERLIETLRSYGRVAVAFSGGVDSAVVAQAVHLAMGEQAVAVTAVSPSLAEGELENATDIARRIGIRHVVIETDEFSRTGYQQNAGNRCYFCKTELYSQMSHRLADWGADVMVNGANLDDQGDHRPGMVAAREHALRSPLLECGLRKADVRALARLWNLPVWDKPASPCLSSRIAYGVTVTPDRVRRVDAAERFLKELLGVRELRVRLEEHDLARIEVPVDALPEAVRRNAEISGKLRELGFQYITLDLEGFRSGSLNAVLPILSSES